jgi:hypothetical protein
VNNPGTNRVQVACLSIDGGILIYLLNVVIWGIRGADYSLLIRDLHSLCIWIRQAIAFSLQKLGYFGLIWLLALIVALKLILRHLHLVILLGGVLSGGIGIRFAFYFLELQNLNQGAVNA